MGPKDVLRGLEPGWRGHSGMMPLRSPGVEVGLNALQLQTVCVGHVPSQAVGFGQSTRN